MSDTHDTMTREQLEAAGYEFDGSQTIESPDGWSWSSWRDDYVLEAATAHYRQQQELARLREAIRAIANALCGCGGDVITDTLPDMFMSDVWACGSVPVCMEVAEVVVSVWPTVSESERAE